MSEVAQRLDKWLWFARFAKTRSDAQKLIERGQVGVNGDIATKASASVRLGDRIALVLGPTRHRVVVRALGARRGPARDAQALYERIGAPERLRMEDAALPLRVHLRPAR